MLLKTHFPSQSIFLEIDKLKFIFLSQHEACKILKLSGCATSRSGGLSGLSFTQTFLLSSSLFQNKAHFKESSSANV